MPTEKSKEESQSTWEGSIKRPAVAYDEGEMPPACVGREPGRTGFFITESPPESDTLEQDAGVIGFKKCIGCNSRTIERKRVSLKNNLSHQETCRGLRCEYVSPRSKQKCNALLCADCIYDTYSQLAASAKKGDKFHPETYDFLDHVLAYQERIAPYPKHPFIGSCCLIQRHHDVVDQIKANAKKKKKEDTDLQLGGAMLYPEFDLLIPSSLSMDILGMQKGTNLKPRFHQVLDEEVASDLLQRNIRPTTVKSLKDSPFQTTYFKMDLDDPEGIKNIMKKKTNKKKKRQNQKLIQVVFVHKRNNIEDNLKGNEIPDDSSISSSFYLDLDSLAGNAFATVVLGLDNDNKKTASVLCCRFHSLKAQDSEKQAKTVLKDMKAQLKNNGLERRRTGGSSGKLRMGSKELKLLLHTENSSPRNSKGVIWLRSKDSLKLHIYYIGTKLKTEDDVTSCKYTYYSTPRPGGSFEMKETMFKKHPWLQTFCRTKPLAALLMKGIENHLKKKKDLPDLSIIEEACDEELQNMEAARFFIQSEYERDQKLKEKDRKLGEGELRNLFWIFYSENFLNFTLVMHPVGLHLDIFANSDDPSLENRVCFYFQLDQQGQTNMTNTGYKYGRGGFGQNNFCFALLDWSGGQRRRRRMWTDPRNQHIPHSATRHAAANNNPNRVVLRPAIWNAFRTAAIANGNYHLPRGINNINHPNLAAQ